MNEFDLTEFWETLTGYQRSQVLFTLIELEIPKLLSGQSRAAEEISAAKNIHPLAMERFLNACVTANLLKTENGRFSNSPMIETYFAADAETNLSGIIKRHSESGFKVWSDLTKSLQNWRYGETAEAAPEPEDQGAAAMADQHNLALLTGRALNKAFDFSKFKKLLDLGGGTGAMSIALCEKNLKLKAVVFDLPENAKIARSFVEKSSLQNRVETAGGDFQKDELPGGFDAVLLANFMSVADAATNQKLLAELYEKLPFGGACILSGWIIDDTHLSPQTSVLFCLEDICRGAPDVERGQKVYSNWLEKAGFKNLRCETYLYPTKMLCGFKL